MQHGQIYVSGSALTNITSYTQYYNR